MSICIGRYIYLLIYLAVMQIYIYISHPHPHKLILWADILSSLMSCKGLLLALLVIGSNPRVRSFRSVCPYTIWKCTVTIIVIWHLLKFSSKSILKRERGTGSFGKADIIVLSWFRSVYGFCDSNLKPIQ